MLPPSLGNKTQISPNDAGAKILKILK